MRLLLGTWLRLLREHGRHIAADRFGAAALLTFTSALHSIQSFFQNAVYRDALERMSPPVAPIFVIGHWRSGTTLLHELLALDPRFAAPTTYACMNPSHFLIAGAAAQHGVTARRPMDRMQVSADSPQEDEFALFALGALSPYAHWLFPAALDARSACFDPELATAGERTRWKAIFTTFLKQLTLRNPRRLVLKSPPHTLRLRLIGEVFPQAVFIHIVRNPYDVFASTRRMYRSMFAIYALTHYSQVALDDYILDGGVLMEEKLDSALPGLGPQRYCRVRYEDLVASPVQCVQRIYAQLDLGDVKSMVPALEEYFRRNAGYAGDDNALPATDAERVARCWRSMFDKYGYAAGQSDDARAA